MMCYLLCILLLINVLLVINSIFLVRGAKNGVFRAPMVRFAGSQLAFLKKSLFCR